MLWAEIVGWLQKVALLTDLDVFWQQRFSVDIICFVFFFEQGILKQKVFQRILNLLYIHIYIYILTLTHKHTHIKFEMKYARIELFFNACLP